MSDGPREDACLADAVTAVAHQLGADIPETGRSMRDLRRFVAGHVARLLDRNPPMLMSILYRVDVDERQVRAAFAEAPPPDLPERLADLLIERELQKVHLRRAHRPPEP